MTEDYYETLDDFLKEEKLQLHVLIAHENPYRPRQSQDRVLNWSCKLTNAKGQWIVVYFSKGIGIRVWKEPPQGILSEGTPHHIPKDKIGKPYDGPMPPFENEKDKETFERCSVPEAPTLKEVTRCLAIDLKNVEIAGGFEKWAIAMESTPDSITARSAFDTIVKQRGEMMQLLGEEAYHKYLYEIELK
jgi:hypothetical protein